MIYRGQGNASRILSWSQYGAETMKRLEYHESATFVLMAHAGEYLLA